VDSKKETTIGAIETAIELILKDFKIRESQMVINHYNLNIAIDRYWRDVTRLHKFHNIKHIDCHKIAGYLTYWICKIKPLEPTIPLFQKKTFGYFANEILSLYVGIGRKN